MRASRRVFLRSCIGAVAAAPFSSAIARAAPTLSHSTIIARARELLRQNASRVAKSDLVAIADFAAPSWHPRFHLVDLVAGKVSSLLTAHGRGSDPSHTGWVKSFSNTPGSFATSRGAFVTGARYDGKYGRAVRLAGLDPENSNAEARAIVIHQAWYVSDDMIAKYGKLGRSEGCFALSDQGLQQTLARLGPGRLLFAGKLDEIPA